MLMAIEGFLLIGAFQSLMMFIPLVANKHYVCGSKTRRNNYWLALLYLAFFLSLVNEYAFLKADECGAPYCLGLSVLFEFLYGPLLYLHIRRITRMERECSGWGAKRHFSPVLVYMILAIAGFGILDRDLWVQSSQLIKMSSHLYLLVYIFLSINGLNKYSAYLKNHSAIFKSYKLWTKFIVTFFIIICVMDIVFQMAKVSKVIDSPIHSLEPVGIVLIVVLIAVFCYSQVELFSSTYLVERQQEQPSLTSLPVEGTGPDPKPQESPEDETSGPCFAETDKYQRNRLTDEDAKLLYERLMAYVEENKPHKMPGLTLSQLAESWRCRLIACPR